MNMKCSLLLLGGRILVGRRQNFLYICIYRMIVGGGGTGAAAAASSLPNSGNNININNNFTCLSLDL